MEIAELIKKRLYRREKVSLPNSGSVPAAVLIPVFEKENEPHILFTRRTENVEHHKGQISFPGGASEGGESSRETALRESYEEIGLNPDDVEILGELDDTKTLASNFVISPFVGHIPYPYPFNPSAWEISEIIELPLECIMDKGNWRIEEGIMNDGTQTQVYFLECNGVVVWGATGKILRQLVDIISG